MVRSSASWRLLFRKDSWSCSSSECSSSSDDLRLLFSLLCSVFLSAHFNPPWASLAISSAKLRASWTQFSWESCSVDWNDKIKHFLLFSVPFSGGIAKREMSDRESFCYSHLFAALYFRGNAMNSDLCHNRSLTPITRESPSFQEVSVVFRRCYFLAEISNAQWEANNHKAAGKHQIPLASIMEIPGDIPAISGRLEYLNNEGSLHYLWREKRGCWLFRKQRDHLLESLTSSLRFKGIFGLTN